MTDILRRVPRLLDRDGRVIATYPVVACPSCGAKVHCTDGWANACPCGRAEFNGSGQLLAPRWQWGEETGETFGHRSDKDDW